MIYRIPIESKYSFVWKCIVEQRPNARWGLYFQAGSRALWNQQESLWLAGLGASSYFGGVRGHVSCLVEFGTTGSFVFWIVANGGKKFNVPLWGVHAIGCFSEEHIKPCSLAGVGLCLKNSVLSGKGSLLWGRGGSHWCRRVRGPWPGAQVRRPVSKGLFVWPRSCKSQGTSLISTRWWVN